MYVGHAQFGGLWGLYDCNKPDPKSRQSSTYVITKKRFVVVSLYPN